MRSNTFNIKFLRIIPLRRVHLSHFRRRRDTSTESFSGTMQDVRLNGNLLEFFDSPDLPAELSATAAALATSDLVEGEVSDDVCATLQPCQNEAQCQDQFFNDYL